jgi:hypothetical protein
LTREDCLAMQEWCREHKDQIEAAAFAGSKRAQTLIRLHKMLVAHSDWPTWAMFGAVLNDVKKELSCPPSS